MKTILSTLTILIPAILIGQGTSKINKYSIGMEINVGHSFPNIDKKQDWWKGTFYPAGAINVLFVNRINQKWIADLGVGITGYALTNKGRAEIYDKQYEQEDLEEIIMFLSSNAGKKYNKSQAILHDKSYELGEKHGGWASQEILKQLESLGFINYQFNRKDCERFHEGTFKSILPNGAEIIIERQKGFQVSRFGDFYAKYKMLILNDCEFSLTLLETDFEPLNEEIGSELVVVPYDIKGNVLRYKAISEDPFNRISIGQFEKIE